jgi:streptomycin 6-kinase
VIGEPAYEIGAFLRNRLPDDLASSEARNLTARRIDQFAEELSLERSRVRDWAMSQAVLSAWWTYEDHGYGWEPMVALAELITRL